jgi:hypothetical protein
MEREEEESRTNESPTSSVESTVTIKSQICDVFLYLPALQEGKVEKKRVAMYPSTVHRDITSMVPRCTSTDMY